MKLFYITVRMKESNRLSLVARHPSGMATEKWSKQGHSHCETADNSVKASSFLLTRKSTLQGYPLAICTSANFIVIVWLPFCNA